MSKERFQEFKDISYETDKRLKPPEIEQREEESLVIKKPEEEKPSGGKRTTLAS